MLTQNEIKLLVSGAQRFLSPEDDPRDDELFDPSRPETPLDNPEDLVVARPTKKAHY